MPQNSKMISPLNWQTLVAEALRRRKEEKLTQRQHAALASVSIPTIVAFDRGEQTLSLNKAFDILRVVGLVEEPPENGAQEIFVRDALARWNKLISKLPPDSPGRFPFGWYRIDYALEGDLKEVELHKFQEILTKAKARNTGWPMFWVPTRQELAPYEVDGVLECWLSPEEVNINRNFRDAAHCDFWRASPNGRMFLIRGYQEDGQETFGPGKIFDTTLPVWRIGEALIHAAQLSALLKQNEINDIMIKFRVHYTGLAGRVLKAWANPLVDLLGEGSGARSDEALLETTVRSSEVETNLAAHIYPMVSSLYERFGVTGTSLDWVAAETTRLQRSRI
jgi:transcriptional regulator with XRE-family HTH domain